MSAVSGLEKQGCGRGCPCMCHELLGGGEEHHGQPCLGKIRLWPATWEGTIWYWTVNGKQSHQPSVF